MKLRAKVLGTISAIAALSAISSGTAYANANVTWKNAYTNGYLQATGTADGASLYTGLDNNLASWYDSYDSYTNAWQEYNNGLGVCLDSNATGSAYTHSCISNDYYQQWFEISTSTGWKLQDYQTLGILDAATTTNVYTNFTDYGNSDSHQRWH